jgi:hypothetical protein
VRNRFFWDCEKIDAITGLADESVCPTLVSKRLGFGVAGAFACQPIFLQTCKEAVAHANMRR